MAMKKMIAVKKHARPHLKPFAPAKTKAKQTRKSGKAINHVAAKPQSPKAAAASNMAPAQPSASAGPNRADQALSQLLKGNG